MQQKLDTLILLKYNIIKRERGRPQQQIFYDYSSYVLQNYNQMKLAMYFYLKCYLLKNRY